MKQLKSKLTGWVSLILIALFLTGCSETLQIKPDLPPIYPTAHDVTVISSSLKRQLVSHNCKVDYKPICKTKGNK